MNSADRAEFDKHLAILCAGMDVPATEERKEAYWRGLQQMSLGVFARTVDFVLTKESWSKIPKPGQLWEVSKRMRASAAPQGPSDDGFRGDAWEAAGNRYLLAHITQRCSITPWAYGKPVDPEKVNKLVAAKKAWASDMRDIAVEGRVPPETQKAVWREYMARAEA